MNSKFEVLSITKEVVWTNKRGLADRYGVGIRTIENWLAWGILVGRMERGELLMDVDDCDQRLKQYEE